MSYKVEYETIFHYNKDYDLCFVASAICLADMYETIFHYNKDYDLPLQSLRPVYWRTRPSSTTTRIKTNT